MLELFCRYYNWHKQIQERLVPFISAGYLLFFSKFNSSLAPFLFPYPPVATFAIAGVEFGYLVTYGNYC